MPRADARERKWSIIQRAKARCGMQAFHLGQSMKRPFNALPTACEARYNRPFPQLPRVPLRLSWSMCLLGFQPAFGVASLALTLKVQRAKHAINDHSHSYAVEKPLKPIRACHAKKNLMTINGLGGH